MEEAKKQNRPPRLEPPKAPPAPSLFSRSRRRAEHKSYRTSHFWRGRLGTKSKQTRHLGDLALHLADRLVVFEACGPLRARAERCSLWRGAASRDYKAAKPLLDWPQTKKRESQREDSIFFGSSKKKSLSSNSTCLQWWCWWDGGLGCCFWLFNTTTDTFIIHKPLVSGLLSSSEPPLNNSPVFLYFSLLLPHGPLINTCDLENIKKKCIPCRKENSSPSVSNSKFSI